MFLLNVKASYDSAHFLRNYKGKCENLHGHHYVVEAGLAFDDVGEGGMAFDFTDAKRAPARHRQRAGPPEHQRPGAVHHPGAQRREPGALDLQQMQARLGAPDGGAPGLRARVGDAQPVGAVLAQAHLVGGGCTSCSPTPSPAPAAARTSACCCWRTAWRSGGWSRAHLGCPNCRSHVPRPRRGVADLRARRRPASSESAESAESADAVGRGRGGGGAAGGADGAGGGERDGAGRGPRRARTPPPSPPWCRSWR